VQKNCTAIHKLWGWRVYVGSSCRATSDELTEPKVLVAASMIGSAQLADWDAITPYRGVAMSLGNSSGPQ
jgi:hypothetical protein